MRALRCSIAELLLEERQYSSLSEAKAQRGLAYVPQVPGLGEDELEIVDRDKRRFKPLLEPQSTSSKSVCSLDMSPSGGNATHLLIDREMRKERLDKLSTHRFVALSAFRDYGPARTAAVGRVA